MPKFSEIFRKLDPSEYNKYSFMLAVKKESEPCFNPIYLDGRSQFVDRAFVTVAGGFSQSPENPCAPLCRPEPERGYDRDDYIYTEQFIKTTSKPDETYDYWVAKGDTPVSLRLFHVAAGNINCALKYTESEEDSAEVLQTDLDSIQCDIQPDDPAEALGFIKDAEAFLNLRLDDNTRLEDLKEKLFSLFNAAVIFHNAMEECVMSYHANYGSDTGNPENKNLKKFLCLDDLICFDIDNWNETFDLLDKISDFEFGKKFAYCDIAGRQQHIATLGDILSQRSNCLFYPKWQELFKWYSNRMQPASFNMAIRDIETHMQNGEFPAWNVFLELCAFDMSQTKDKYSFLINNTGTWEWRTFAKRGSCSTSRCKYHINHNPHPLGICLLNPTSPYWETPRWTTTKNFCYDPQMITILTNLYYIYDCAQNEIEGNQDQKENIKKRVRQDLDFNFSIIARAIRVFCENVLLALYKIGWVPCMKITCKEDGSGGYCFRDNAAQKGDKVFKEIYYCGPQVKQDRIKYDAIRIKNKDDAIDQAYQDKDHLLQCREVILNLLNIANPEMHATGESPKFDEYADILGNIEDISKEVLGLLKNAGVS